MGPKVVRSRRLADEHIRSILGIPGAGETSPPSRTPPIRQRSPVNGIAELAQAATVARAARPDVPLALATLVQVEGSSYRQPGARLLVDAKSRVLAGAVSGGCLEGDVAARAAAVCSSGRAVKLTYDLRADLQAIWGLGAACDGVAHLLLEPLPDWQWMVEAEMIAKRRHGGCLLVACDEGDGSGTWALLDGPASTGKWQFLHDRARDFSVAELSAMASTAQRTGVPHTYQSQAIARMSAFVEPLPAPPALHVVGASRGAEGFAAIAVTMGWQVTVIDHRPALLDALQLPHGVAKILIRSLDTIQDTLSALPHDGRTGIALLTHMFDADVAWLAAALPLPVGYVGVLGSRSRGAQVLAAVQETLGARGTPLTAPMRRKLHIPIGLDLGGEAPSSIALSAIAEMEAVLHDRPAGFLRERQSPIHTRTPCPRISVTGGAVSGE